MAKTTVNLDDDLLRAAKKHAIDEGTTLGRLIERGLVLAMGAGAPGAPRRSFQDLPSHRGGRMLVDVTDRRAMYELLDADDHRLEPHLRDEPDR